MDLSKATFWGYKRENGRVGVRNHVIILPLDDLSNEASEAVAHNIKGAMAIPHDLREAAHVMRLSRWTRWRRLILTGIFPSLVTGWVTAAGGAPAATATAG